MVQYRHFHSSSGAHHFDSYSVDPHLLRGLQRFIADLGEELGPRALTERQIHVDENTNGASLLDYVYSWMNNDPGFFEACPTREDYLLTVIMILDPDIRREAEQGYLHPALSEVGYGVATAIPLPDEAH